MSTYNQLDTEERLEDARAAARAEGRDEGLVQGFADCEALVVAMLDRMIYSFLSPEDCNLLATANAARQLRCETPEQKLIGKLRTALISLPLAVTTGQHRTDAYDPEQLATAHRKAAHGDLTSRGGKARALALSPERRREIAQKASDAALTARRTRAKGE